MVFYVGNHRLYHESYIVSLELLGINRQTLLTPAEFNDLETVFLREFSHHLPEELDSPRFFSEASRILGVLLQKIHFDPRAATNYQLQFFGS